MYSNKDKLYLQTKDMPILKEKLERAKELSAELALVLNDIDSYNLEFEIKKEEKLMTVVKTPNIKYKRISLYFATSFFIIVDSYLIFRRLE